MRVKCNESGVVYKARDSRNKKCNFKKSFLYVPIDSVGFLFWNAWYRNQKTFLYYFFCTVEAKTVTSRQWYLWQLIIPTQTILGNKIKKSAIFEPFFIIKQNIYFLLEIFSLTKLKYTLYFIIWLSIKLCILYFVLYRK